MQNPSKGRGAEISARRAIPSLDAHHSTVAETM